MSLEGKANRLAAMIRGNLAMAMQGLSVVPLFAGYDADTGIGRIFSYDVTGGCYEEHDHHSVGSGSLFARGALKKLYRRAGTRRRRGARRGRGALRRRRRRLGHRRARRRPPHLADDRRRRRRRARASCPTTRSRRWSTPSSRPASTTREVPDDRRDAVLRLARAADEGPGRLRAQGHRARPGGRRRSPTTTASPSSPRTRAGPCTRSPRSTTASRSRRSASTTSSRTFGWPACATPTCAATPTTGPTSPRAAWPTPTRRPWARSSPRSPSRTRSRSSWPRSARPPTTDQVYRLTYDGSVADEHGFVAMGGASGADRDRPEGAVAPRA